MPKKKCDAGMSVFFCFLVTAKGANPPIRALIPFFVVEVCAELVKMPGLRHACIVYVYLGDERKQENKNKIKIASMLPKRATNVEMIPKLRFESCFSNSHSRYSSLDCRTATASLELFAALVSPRIHQTNTASNAHVVCT